MRDCLLYVGPHASAALASLCETGDDVRQYEVVELGTHAVALVDRNCDAAAQAARHITVGMRSPVLPDAHGIDITWDDNHVMVEADSFEQRRTYWQRYAGGTVVATRLDLLPMQPHTVCTATFAAQWCLSMNMSTRPLFANAQRLRSGEQLVIAAHGQARLQQATAPSGNAADVYGAVHVLRETLRAYASTHDVVLGLSGGLDSRTLAAAMLNAGIPFRVHTYGTPAMADVQRAVQVATAAGVPYTVTQLDAMAWKVDAVLRSMQRTAWQSEGSYPGAHALVFDDAIERLGSNALLVDGGYGALWRGGFGNQLLARYAAALASRQGAIVAGALLRRSPELLREDLRRTALQQCQALVQQALDAMPTFQRRDGRAWMDEFFLRWNPQGYVASPQAVYDARISSVMPFLDRRFAAAARAVPAKRRANAALFRSVLRGSPAIAGIPYVGKRTDTPFFATGRPLASALWSHLRPPYPAVPGIDHVAYRLLRPAMLDLALSTNTAPFDLFDKGAVLHLLETTKPDGDAGSIAQLLDWLSFRLMAMPKMP